MMHGLPTLSLLAVSLSACAAVAPRLVTFSSNSTPPGCVRVSSGRDVNHDGRLDEAEVLETELACDDPSGGQAELALDVGPETVAPASDRSLICIDGGRTPAAGATALATRLSRRSRPAPRRRPSARRRVQRRWLATILRRFVALVSPPRAG